MYKIRCNPQLSRILLRYGSMTLAHFICGKGNWMTKLDKTTAQELDQEIERMTEDEQNQLATQGSRILKGTGTDEGRKKAREYMRRYKQRIALAAQRGMLEPSNSGNADRRD